MNKKIQQNTNALNNTSKNEVETTIFYQFFSTNLGLIILAIENEHVVYASLSDNEINLFEDFYYIFKNNHLIKTNENILLNQYCKTLEQYLKLPGSVNLTSIPIKTKGTQLQEDVWKCLRTINVGDTLSYKDVALRINKPTASRAVANACAANTIAFFIPCHRVIKSDGSLSGYRWGTNLKQYLLHMENK